jgi:hypothetical protein
MEWCETPPVLWRRGRPSVWAPRLAELRKRPGQWAAIRDVHSATASTLKQGRLGDARPGEFEAVMRSVDRATNRGTLYIRYVADEPFHDEAEQAS